MSATPTRIEDDVYEAAKVAGSVMSRSAAQQVNHWARIGRELEAAHGISHRDVVEVLAGRASYDDLTGREQAVVRAEWEERAQVLRANLNFESEFTAASDTWCEATPEGATVRRGTH